MQVSFPFRPNEFLQGAKLVRPVSAVIVNHNAGSVLGDCLRSIVGQVDELVLVDNGSHPGSLDAILGSEFDLGSIRIVRSPKNIGFAAACNLGLRLCTHDMMLLLNPDSIAMPNLVRCLVETLESNPKAGMVGGGIRNMDGTEQRGARRLIPSPWRVLSSGIGFQLLSAFFPQLLQDFNLNAQPLPSEPIEVEAVSGACMLLRRAALEDVGLMDEDFFLHCEDLDLCLRFSKQAWKILFDPNARAVHLKGACGRRKPFFVEWHKHRGMLIFYKKHFLSEYPAIIFPIIWIVVWMRFADVAILLFAGIRRQTHARPSHFSETLPENLGRTPHSRPEEKDTSLVGVVGASSFVGSFLLPLLSARPCRVVAFSRQERTSNCAELVWDSFERQSEKQPAMVSGWISLCPLPVLASLLPLLAARGAKRVVAVSSTSRFTKVDASDASERRLSKALAEAEESILKWAGETGVDVVILRPTLIYDGVRDKNIAAISRFVRRWGWFPVLPPASGLRQPLHVADLARACVDALTTKTQRGIYNLSGGETISYREIVERIFAWEGLHPRIVELPEWSVKLALQAIKWIPGFQGFPSGVFERMNKDLVFDHGDAAESLRFRPRGFVAPRIRESSC